jgi:hypothetical protein
MASCLPHLCHRLSCPIAAEGPRALRKRALDPLAQVELDALALRKRASHHPAHSDKAGGSHRGGVRRGEEWVLRCGLGLCFLAQVQNFY